MGRETAFAFLRDFADLGVFVGVEDDTGTVRRKVREEEETTNPMDFRLIISTAAHIVKTLGGENPPTPGCRMRQWHARPRLPVLMALHPA